MEESEDSSDHEETASRSKSSKRTDRSDRSDSSESTDSAESSDSAETADKSETAHRTPSTNKDQKSKHLQINTQESDSENKQDASIPPVQRRSLSPTPAHRFIEESRLTPILSPTYISPRSKNVSFSTIHSVLTEDDEIIYVDENDDIFSS